MWIEGQVPQHRPLRTIFSDQWVPQNIGQERQRNTANPQRQKQPLVLQLDHKKIHLGEGQTTPTATLRRSKFHPLVKDSLYAHRY